MRGLLIRVDPVQLDAAPWAWHEAYGPADSAPAIDGDDELLIALAGDLAGRGERRITEDLFRRDEAAAHWSPDGWM